MTITELGTIKEASNSRKKATSNSYNNTHKVPSKVVVIVTINCIKITNIVNNHVQHKYLRYQRNGNEGEKRV